MNDGQETLNAQYRTEGIEDEMSFLMGGSAPAAPPPPPTPPTAANANVEAAQSAAQYAAAAASGKGGFNRTVNTSQQGAASPSTAPKALFGA